MISNTGLSAGRTHGKRQAGFTLIELSIVLTIIGLIVGGVLKGQELINNARIKSQMAQIDRIKTGVLTFQDRYGYLPGDDPNSTSLAAFTGANGDGNGAIAAPGALAIVDSATVVSTESITAWAHLSAANLLAGYNLATIPLISVGGGSTAPFVAGKISGSNLWLANFSNTTTGQTNLAVRLQNDLLGAIPTLGLRVADMQGLDAKYDDGLPYSGSIQIAASSSTTNCAAAATTSLYVTAPTSVSALNCVPMFFVQ